MKNLKDIISEKLIINKNTKVQNIFSKFPELKKLDFSIDVDSLIGEIKEYFINVDAYEEKQKKQLDKLISLIPKGTKFAKTDEDTGWDINDYLRELGKEVNILCKIVGEDYNPTASLYSIKDDLVIQIVDDEAQEVLTYISDTNK